MSGGCARRMSADHFHPDGRTGLQLQRRGGLLAVALNPGGRDDASRPSAGTGCLNQTSYGHCAVGRFFCQERERPGVRTGATPSPETLPF